MKLIELLVQELPRRGGFPEGANECVQDSDGTVKFFDSGSLSFGGYGWSGSARGKFYCKSEDKITGLALSCDYNSSIVTRTQYESALEASEGWTEWAGGECPVKIGELVDIRHGNGDELHGVRAAPKSDFSYTADMFWKHKGHPALNIIAYRLHDQGINARANDDRMEQDLNECIGQGVAAEWDGEGLPPAGCECEARYRNADKWVFFRCVGVDCGVAFGWLGKEAATLGCGSYEFRPLRTEAERLRDEAGLALYHAINWNAEGEMVRPSRMEDYKKAYDAIAAGKIPGVKMEEK